MNELDQAETPPAPAQENYVTVIADIVSAYVSNNAVTAHELPELIASVHQAITGLGREPTSDATPAKREPAVSVKKALGDGEYLISMIDGRKYRTLKRHVSKHGFTPESYRAEFGLPSTFPMTAPNYSAKRSSLAKEIGLGISKGKGADAVSPKPEKLVPKDGARGRGRPRKAA